MKFSGWLKEIFTDSKGRPEIKNILGVPSTLIGLIIGAIAGIKCLFVDNFHYDWSGWAIFMGVAIGLIVTTAITDGINDSQNKG